MTDRIDDDDDDVSFEEQPLCLVTLNHPSLLSRLVHSHFVCISFLSACAKSIHHRIDSVLLRSPFKSQVRKAVDFSCAVHSTEMASLPPPPPLLYWVPLMQRGKGFNQIYLVIYFVYILTLCDFNLTDLDCQIIMKYILY